jgi:hypothetical protein
MKVTTRVHAAELGFDAGATLQLIDDDSRNIISVAAPAPGNLGVFSLQTTRLGLSVAQNGQIETSLGFSMVSEEQFLGGRRTLAHLLLGASYLHNLANDIHRSPYLRVGTSLRQLMATQQAALTQVGVGGGIGIRHPLGRVLSVRLQASTTRWFHNTDLPGHWDIAGDCGISAFTDH